MLKIGVVGLNLGMRHVEALLSGLDGAELTAVCDMKTERLELVRGDIVKFTDYDEFLEKAPIDAVVMAVPHIVHAEMSLKALEHGKHLLLEKPMAVNAAECSSMNEKAKEQGLILMIAQNWRYTPWCLEAKKIIDSGDLGKIRLIRSDWVLNFHDFYPQGLWIYDGKLAGGGAIISLVVHNLDFLRFLFGEVQTVYAKHLYTDDWSSNGSENMSMVQMEFQSGALGQMLTSYTPFINDDSGPLQVYGDQGVLTKKEGQLKIASAQNSTSSVAAERKFKDVSISDQWGKNFAVNQMSHFIDCAAHNKTPISSGEDNINTIRLVDAIYESAKTGLPVEIKYQI
jgi:predicted dehydrogenase